MQRRIITARRPLFVSEKVNMLLIARRQGEAFWVGRVYVTVLAIAPAIRLRIDQSGRRTVRDVQVGDRIRVLNNRQPGEIIILKSQETDRTILGINAPKDVLIVRAELLTNKGGHNDAALDSQN